MSKFFLINPNKEHLDYTDVLEIEKEKVERINASMTAVEVLADQVLHEEDTLKYVEGKIIVKVDTEGKNSHRFENGTTIRRERQFNNLNFRETSPVNAIVISAEKVPRETEILVDYHSIHDSNKIFNYKNKSKQIQYYSIKQEDCYLWKDENNEWQPIPPYDLALRVFKKYDTVISWMKPEKIADMLFVTTGELKGKIVQTLVACDYECVFQDVNGREGNRIRFLPFGNESVNKEPEAICIRHDLMKELEDEKLLIGYTIEDCKSLKTFGYVSNK